MAMLLTAVTAVMFGSVSANPGTFAINTPTADTFYKFGTTVNISWDSANASGTIAYNVSIDGTPLTNTSNIYYNWNTTFYDRGAHVISVYAWNWTDYTRTYATGDNISVNITCGTPGVDIWQGGNYTVTGTDNCTLLGKPTGNGEVLNISTDELKYGAVIDPDDFEINGSLTWGTTAYCLYYPVYNGSHGYSYYLSWARYGGGSADVPEVQMPNDKKFGDSDELDVTLNRSGLWLIGPKTGFNPDASSLAQMNATIPAWFWVNVTPDLSMSISDDDFDYDASGNIIINVTGPAALDEARVAIFNETNRLIGISGTDWYRNQPTDDGELSVNKNLSYFTHAGYYNVTSFFDVDGYNEAGARIKYREGTDFYRYYNLSYGDTTYTPLIVDQYGVYLYDTCGPWDPPELNATVDEIFVDTAAPYKITLTNATQNWEFDGRLDINVTDSDGNAMLGLNVTILNETGEYPFVYYGADTIATGSSVSANWSEGKKGTWTVVLSANVAGDSMEEWNGTAEFEVVAAPGLQIMVKDDGDGDNDLEVPAGPPVITELQGGTYWTINFTVVNESHAAYGNSPAVDEGDEAHAMANITISGDACLLSGKTLKELDEIGSGMVTRKGKYWEVNLIPTMDTAANGGGVITISAAWEDHGGTADDVDIHVGGSDNNGTLVSISPSEITIDHNVTLTVTVTDPESPDYGYKDVHVYLYYINDSGGLDYTFNDTYTTTTSGEATFHFNRTQQTENQSTVDGWTTWKANRYIVAYAKVGSSDYGYGYAKIVPNHNFKVTAEAGDSPGLSTMMAGRDYDNMWFNVSIIDDIGNETGTPTVGTGQDILYVRLYDETGEDVTNSITASFNTDDDLNITDEDKMKLDGRNHYIVTPGVYTVYAYNNTYDSEGHNATLTVQRVDVTSTLEELIWQYDDNVSVIFTVKYNGELVNGTLLIDNLTDVGDYNQTWVLTNYSGTPDTPAGTNMTVEVTNGVVTVHNITANILPAGVAQKNITFWFEPEKAHSKYARASGMVPVKIPDVDASPSSIPYDKPAKVTITVTGRDIPLEGVWISIVVPGLSGEFNTTTDAQGEAKFAFTPQTTGDVIIKVENRTSDTVIKVTSWELYLDIPSTVDEGTSFTATVRNGTAAGAGLAGATVTFNKLTYTTESDGTTTPIAAGSVTESTTYTVVATKEGYAEDSDTIKVLNLPQLAITVSGSKDGDEYISPVTVTVYDDTGSLITGATVTFDGSSSTTVNGQTTVEVSEKTTGEITATFTGFSPADPVTITIKPAGIPGFELLTLIAAIGVAFILLRRRRH